MAMLFTREAASTIALCGIVERLENANYHENKVEAGCCVVKFAGAKVRLMSLHQAPSR